MLQVRSLNFSFVKHLALNIWLAQFLWRTLCWELSLSVDLLPGSGREVMDDASVPQNVGEKGVGSSLSSLSLQRSSLDLFFRVCQPEERDSAPAGLSRAGCIYARVVFRGRLLRTAEIIVSPPAPGLMLQPFFSLLRAFCETVYSDRHGPAILLCWQHANCLHAEILQETWDDVKQ